MPLHNHVKYKAQLSSNKFPHREQVLTHAKYATTSNLTMALFPNSLPVPFHTAG